jgi:hypothetical protein
VVHGARRARRRLRALRQRAAAPVPERRQPRRVTDRRFDRLEEGAGIVGKASVITAISRDEFREIYLRRQRLWPSGARVVPIILSADHPARARFSQLVLGRSLNDLTSYWNARYFEGVTPPAVVRSAAAVRAYLAAEPDAIAYLPLADVDETCRVILVLGR